MIKQLLILSIIALLPTLSFAQNKSVGINTTDPTRTLDVNGDLRVRTIENIKESTDEKDNFKILTAESSTKSSSDNHDLRAIADYETNVIRGVKPKFDYTLKNTLDKTYISGTDFTDGQLKQLKFTSPSPDAINQQTDNDDYRIDGNGTITIKKSGFYLINLNLQATLAKKTTPNLTNTYYNPTEGNDERKFGIIEATIYNNGTILTSDSKNIYLGSHIYRARVSTQDNLGDDNNEGAKYTELGMTTSVFLKKGDKLSVKFKATKFDHMIDEQGVITLRSNEKQSILTIIRNL